MTRRELEAEAARWLGMRDRGFTPAEETAFAAWQAREAGAQAAVRDVAGAWTALDRLRSLAPQDGCVPDPDALKVTVSRPAWRVPAVLITAAAATVAAALSLWTLREPAKPTVHPYATESGGFSRVVLEDGSQVELNETTSIEVQFTPAERRVRLLRGEANFHVAKNPARPFIVAAGTVGVRAVGTIFDVRLAQDTVAVLVTEGKVSASAPHELMLVSAGQRVTIAAAPRARSSPVANVATVDVDRAMAWEGRSLDLEEMPLGDLVAEFNRHNSGRLVLADPDLAGMHVSGRFRLDNEEAFLRLLDTTFGIRASRTVSGEILLHAAH